MLCYFIKDIYNGNTYKLSKYFLNNEYYQNPQKKLDFNFKPADGNVTIMTRQIVLPDETSLRDYTHMLVPEVNKIYEIRSIDQQNSDQYSINLLEDAFIGNYQQFKNEDMIITRTTDYKPDWFQGVTDITDMSYDYTYKTTDILPEQNGSGSDIWAAVYIQAPDQELYDKIESVKYNVSTTSGRLQAETFDNKKALRNKYPDLLIYSSNQDVALNKFFSLDYKYKIAYVKADNKYYYYAIWHTKENNSYNMGWKEVNKYDRNFSPLDKSFLTRTVNNSPDLSTVIMLIPNYEGISLISKDPNLTTNYFVPSMSRFSGLTYILNDSTKVAANILGVRLIPESLLNTEGQLRINSWGLDVSGLDSFTNIWTISAKLSIYEQGLTLNSLKEEIDVSLKGITDTIWNKEPFKTYELWIFGQKYDIPSYFVNDLHMVLSSTSDGIQYNVYRDDERRKLYLSGKTSWDMKWKADQLEIYAMNNPTYKDEFNNKMQQKWAQTLVGGTAGIAGAGAIMGTAGLAVGGIGMAAGAISTGISNKFDRKQFELMQANKRMTPDQIYGDASGAAMVNKIHNGIYWLVKTHNNNLQMKLQYNRIGYPTYMKKTIMDITPIINTSVGSRARVLTGYFVNTIKNNYVTNEINKKLSEGVILVE